MLFIIISLLTSCVFPQVAQKDTNIPSNSFCLDINIQIMFGEKDNNGLYSPTW
jgi:hypothetical protein